MPCTEGSSYSPEAEWFCILSEITPQLNGGAQILTQADCLGSPSMAPPTSRRHYFLTLSELQASRETVELGHLAASACQLSMATTQWPSVILGRQVYLSRPYADTCWYCHRKRVNGRKLLSELNQCFLHIKLRTLVSC